MATPKELARTVVAAVVGPLRATFGRRVVNWTPEFMGFGNQLYLWVWAHAGRLDAVPRKVLVVDKMRPWAALAPDFARDYLVERSEVRFLDRRDYLWARPQEHTGHPRGFSQTQLEKFVQECLLPAPLLAGVGGGPLASSESLTLNVRRGDYYSDEGHRQLHGIDLEAYLRLAVEGSVAADGRPRRLHVVSDDEAWCRAHLPWLEDHADQVTFAPASDPPEQNFRDICSSRRLVISNSTFSMWGAWISTTVFGDNARQVWAPAFFMASYGPGRCYEYDEGWSFVDDLPGGWQPAWVLEGRDTP